MQLILAIEPDRRQAQQITSMVRAHLSAELVIAGSTAKALKALGERVPDLILTPALLPPADDALLADRLRELGPAAGHIQAVTIPILSEAGSGEEQGRGMLSALRRGGSRTAEGGCEPAVFINQVSTYLQRAAQERQARASSDAPAVLVTEPEPRPEDMQLVPTTPTPELAEWLDMDQVMAAISDRSVVPEPPVVTRVQAPPAPVAPPPSRKAPVQATPAPVPLPQYVAAPPVPVPQPIQVTPIDEEIAPLRLEEEADEDEWVFFDPRQYGFPALLAKLESLASVDNNAAS